MGFKLVECPFPYSVDAGILRKEADKFGLKHVFINTPPGIGFFENYLIFLGDFAGGERGFASIQSKKDQYLESLDMAIHYAKVLDCPR